MVLAMLSEVFSGNGCAETFAMTRPMLEALVAAMNCTSEQTEGTSQDCDGELKDCAAVVLHNASNIPRVAAMIVEVPNMLDTLKDLCMGPNCAVPSNPPPWHVLTNLSQ